jgi:hypothetical protein
VTAATATDRAIDPATAPTTDPTVGPFVAELDRLLALTPSPPDDGEPDAVLSAFAELDQRRADVLTALAALPRPPTDDPRIRARQQELVAREQAWLGALGRAQLLVEQRMHAVRRARAVR